ncbi:MULTISPECIES: hypothetical protein [Lactiplantibacillus]|uniref:hypothetical protein n=1 Tax=Lactiplantibacillus TaxID=2767842 RepID=UPI0007B54C3F|nr:MULTISPECIES: hypothetical protein [Lactiplantibacillus]ANI95832.1 hypothetical protein A9F05_09715 [Lactiplantibacillus plantarum]AYG27303.1 hypothetical protein CFI62_04600 [Lactiplantibacillus plantarum]KZU21309.1 hypothetical protein Nizo2484_1482 [Lactiplantibacillus plantarum]KZU27705.1 hypothetical protein Nizo2485_1107 [Lactiplantibacillus plantarum]MBO9166440.1 hypothetical protein [Lactiplantibacillus pentosus]
MKMNRILAVGATLLMGIILAGCGKNLSAESHDSHNGFTIPITGKSSESAVYWKTDADGINKVKTKNGEFSFEVPSKTHKFTIGVSNSKDMSDMKTIDFKGEKSIADYSTFYDAYDFNDGNSINFLPTTPSDDKNYADDTKNDVFLIHTDDGKLLGLNVYTKYDYSWFNEIVYAIGDSLDADTGTLESGVKSASEKPGQYITKKSGKTNYTFVINTKKDTYQMFVHS